MIDTVMFCVACNNPDNGEFDGRASAIVYNGEAEIEADSLEGYAFAEVKGGIRLHRKIFRTVGFKIWSGNWCWNSYLMERAEAKRFITTLRSSPRWRCTSGPSRWYEWFNREETSIPAG